jgi:pilus assembly protein Flp/PilA
MGMWKQLGKLSRDQRGATAVEYGLIIALIVLAMVGALNHFADTTIDIWDHVATEVTNA